MVDKLSSGIVGGNFHLWTTIRQHVYLQRFSSRLGAAVTWIGLGAEYREEGKHDHEGWRFCHYDAAARGGRSAEIFGEITVGCVINANRGGFASHSACPFLAPFSSVLNTPELGCCLKSNNPSNGQYIFLRGLLTPYTSGIYSRR